jgi:hypothetical protein
MRLKTFLVAAALAGASMLAAATPAHAAEKPIVAQSSTVEIRTITVELPSPDLTVGDGVYVCTGNLWAWYAGNGHNLATGEVICSIRMRLITMSITWYYANTGLPARYEPTRLCRDTTYCAQGGSFDSWVYNV